MTTNADLKIEFLDSGEAPKLRSNPSFPNGVDLEIGEGSARCWVKLPSMKTTGLYIIKCGICGRAAAITVAGRRDDPRSLSLACATHGRKK